MDYQLNIPISLSFHQWIWLHFFHAMHTFMIRNWLRKQQSAEKDVSNTSIAKNQRELSFPENITDHAIVNLI